MTEQDSNMSIIRRMDTDVFDQQDLDLAEAIVAAQFKNHAAPPGWPDGPEAITTVVRMLFAAFPDDRHDIEDIFASGDCVAARKQLATLAQAMTNLCNAARRMWLFAFGASWDRVTTGPSWALA